MGTSKSARKRERQNLKRRLRNRANRSRVKTKVKHFLKALETSAEAGEKDLPVVFRAADQGARKGAIPKKRADRLKSRLAKKLHRLKTGT